MSKQTTALLLRTKKGTTPINNFFGGNPLLTENQQMPTCSTCESYLTHIASIDTRELPYGGLMKSTGRYGIYICCDECPGFSSFSKIETSIMKYSGNNEKIAKNSLHEGQIVFPKHVFTSNEICDVNDASEQNCTYIHADKDKTTIVLNLSSMFHIPFVSKKGKHVFLKNLILEDTEENGLEIVGINMPQVKNEKPPVKITVEEDSEDETVQTKKASVTQNKSVKEPVTQTKKEPVTQTKKEPVTQNKSDTISYSDILKTAATAPAPKPKIVSNKPENVSVVEEKKVEEKKVEEWVVVGKDEKEKKQKALLEKQKKIQRQLAYLEKDNDE